MIWEIRTTSKDEIDSRGQDLLFEIKRTLHIKSIKNIKTAKVYRLEGILERDARKFAEVVLFEPIDQRMTFNEPIFKNADSIVEVAYKAGVMNPEAGSLLKSAGDIGIKLKAADSSFEYVFFGKVSKEQLEKIIKRLLVNETIETVVLAPPKTLKISGRVGPVAIIPIRNMSDDELMDLSRDRLFLNHEEMKVIQNYFRKIKRDPTDCEVEVLAQTWSEHCVHKTFKAKLIIDGKEKKPLLSRIKSTAKYRRKLIVSAFIDNSGVIDFYDGLAICGKVETHNSPSAIEPYGGAMTGSGGVFRDILGTGQGAKVVASTDIFCFAPSDLPAEFIPQGCLPPDYLLRKVVAGVRDYGNPVGIPTNNGSIHFHPDFRAKPTVAVGSYGLIPKKRAKKGVVQTGDVIVTIGGRTGRDGIHGATFSSGEMTDRTINVSGSAVQIGNAIEEKRVIDAVLAMSNEGLIRAVTDCGAGGYSSAIGEMGAKHGAEVYLEKVPVKYTGLAPWEIFLSESQERMVLAIDPKNIGRAQRIAKLYNVEMTAIGKFTQSKKLKVIYAKKTVCDLNMQFLHHGLPQRKMVGRTSPRLIREKLPKINHDLSKIWLKIMAHGNVCSKESIVRMYDHNVQGTNALSPFGGVNLDAPNDGAIVRPILTKPYGLVISHGLNPVLNTIDPYHGSIWAILEAVSNYVSCGGDIADAALIDNFIWPFPDKESLADLDRAVDACVDAARVFGVPFVSGKDSLSSTYRYPDPPRLARSSGEAGGKVLKIPPVLLISVFGRIPDVAKTVSSDFKKMGSTIVLIGKQDTLSLGGSVYFDITGSASPNVPTQNLKEASRIFSSLTAAIRIGGVLACHDISEGGLAAGLAEMCFGGDCGANINLPLTSTSEEPEPFDSTQDKLTPEVEKIRPDFILFNETPAMFLVEVENAKIAKKLFAKVPHYILGETVKQPIITVNQAAKKIAQISVAKLKTAWQKPMKEIFH